MDRSINILHVSGATGWRGGEQQVAYLIQHLPDSVTSLLLLPKGAPLEVAVEELPVATFTYKKRMGMDINGARMIRNILFKNNIDIIHLHDSHAHNLYVLAHSLFGVKIPAVLHRRVDFPPGNNPITRYKYNLASIRKIICVSEKVKEVMRTVVHGSSKFVVIHSGINIEKFSNPEVPSLNIRKQYQLPADAVIIGNVAALADHKDHATFIGTASVFLKTQANAYFFIAGTGELESEIKKKIRKEGLEGRVFLYGNCPSIPSFLKELDVFLYTSKEEGLGTAILEAMAAGIPVVSTNAGGIPEIISDGINGLMTNVGNSIQLAENCRKLINQPELKKQLTEQAKQTIQHFTCTSTANAVNSVYREITGNG
jgi:L-malate glycosyltransferase